MRRSAPLWAAPCCDRFRRTESGLRGLLRIALWPDGVVMRYVTAVMLIVLLISLNWAYQGKNAWGDYIDRKVELNELQKNIKSLRDRNSLLEKDIEDLNGGIDGIEESARTELGYVREGESFIRVIDRSGY